MLPVIIYPLMVPILIAAIELTNDRFKSSANRRPNAMDSRSGGIRYWFYRFGLDAGRHNSGELDDNERLGIFLCAKNS